MVVKPIRGISQAVPVITCGKHGGGIRRPDADPLQFRHGDPFGIASCPPLSLE